MHIYHAIIIVSRCMYTICVHTNQHDIFHTTIFRPLQNALNYMPTVSHDTIQSFPFDPIFATPIHVLQNPHVWEIFLNVV